MGLFSATPPVTIGVLFDVGSASVLVAVVASDPRMAYPNIIWSHRELAAQRESSSSEQMSKNVLTALFNASLELSTVGMKVLKQALPKSGVPKQVQVTVTAPWAHTVTKTIIYNQDEPFKMTAAVLADLETAVQKMIATDLNENALLAKLDLKIFTAVTSEVLANGYAVAETTGQTIHTLTLSRTNALLSAGFIDAVAEIEEKMFKLASTRGYSFMLAYFNVSRLLYPELLEYCLIDVTIEGIEVGIVRDGVLRYCAHLPYGAYTLARAIALIRQVTTEEAYGSMINGLVVDSNESTKQTALLEELMTRFETSVAGLLFETGNTLSIPKTLLVHSGLSSETFFCDRVRKAATKATRGSHTVIPISEELLKRYYPPEIKPQLTARHDTAVLLTAQFFHTQTKAGGEG